MQIKIYLLFIITFTFISVKSTAQELFPKKELYHIWILADEKLDAGLFDDALRLYNSHAENPSFSMKIRQVARLKEINSEADKLRKRGQYAEAVEKYKEYRKLKAMGTLAVFEKKIEECLNQINKGKLTELTVQQRIITGFEFAHRGREKLSKLDTAGAKRDFNNAKILGGNRNNILKEQYNEGIRVTNELTKWGRNNLKNITTDHKKELAALESYRNIRNIDIPDIELRIKELKTEIDGNTSLSAIAKLCDTGLLIKYVNTHKSSIGASAFLISRLNEFLSTQKKINLLKADPTNAETVKSAYSSLLSWTDDLPMEIQKDVKNCIETDYKEFIKSLPEISVTLTTPAARIVKCSGLEDFNQGLKLIRKELAGCNAIRARTLWQTNISFLKDCDDAKVIIKANQNLIDSLNLMVRQDSVLNIYRAQILRNSKAGECEKTVKIYNQMKSVLVCNQDALNKEIEEGLAQIKSCEKKACWRPELTASFARNMPKYAIAGSSKKMEPGSTASAGIQYTFLDHKNPVDFVMGLEYNKTSYYATDTHGSILEDFKLSGANAIIAIKLHKPNTNPDKIRPYIKFGTQAFIPTSYQYENYSNMEKVNSTEQLQKTVFFAIGAIGVEIQKEHFGAFIEGFANYGLGSIYNSGMSHMNATTSQKVDARLHQVGIKAGFRLW